jgi:hypothetical protein
MAKERIHTSRAGSGVTYDISVQWDRGQPEIQPIGEDGYGWVSIELAERGQEAPVALAALSRQQINSLVRVLRRARNVAFDVDE